MFRSSTEAIVDRFNQVFQQHDPAALSEIVADECVIENTGPAPDGARFEGRSACIELWTRIATTPGTSFTLEKVETFGERALIFWCLHFGAGDQQRVRGLNVMRIVAGRIVEALGYVKAG